MWNLFSNIEPKVTRPAKSLKDQLLLQQSKALEQIEQQAKLMLGSINAILKSNALMPPQNHPESQKHQVLAKELQEAVVSLHDRLQRDNEIFQTYITFRDQQKMNNQDFFKATMKSYEHKKSELKKCIQQLEEKVQQLQILGFKTYSLTPKQDNVLCGINKNQIDKYWTKLQLLKNIQQDMNNILAKNNQKQIKNKNILSSTQFTQIKGSKISLLHNSNQFNSIADLENQLQTILLKEEIVGEILNNKIRKCKKHFVKLASQEVILKQGLKKIGILNEQRKRSSVKLSTTSKENSFNIGFKKISSQMGANIKKVTNLNPSIYDQKIEEREELRKTVSQFDQQIHLQKGNNEQEEDEELQIPSTNFLEACEVLITERFIKDSQEDIKFMLGQQVNDQDQ